LPVPSPEHDTLTLPASRADLAKAVAAHFVLVVTDGPDGGATFSIDGSEPGPVLLGQSPACAIRLTDRQVSRRHAAFTSTDQRLRVTDLGSRNGTWVNGIGVADAWLRGDEVLRVGETVLRVQLAAPSTIVSLSTATAFGQIVGASEAMRRLYPLCERLAQTTVVAILEGETGTGKEVLAESLHEQGARSGAPFVVFDCTAVPPNLVESELFGHERGSFTGAVSTRKGVFEQAQGGTLLIDEIGDLDPLLQPKLLRAIERSEIRRIGSERTLKVDVRVLCATRRDLDREVQAGRFRDDLFHRIAVARIELPPLRHRKGDVPLLVRHFARQLGYDSAAVPDALLIRWEEYGWPGNVRELRNAVMRQVALGELGGLGALEAPADRQAPSLSSDVVASVVAEGLPYVQARARVLESFEQRYVERMLENHGGNVMRAAAASGIARRHFQRVKSRSLK
jgi:transcriptional regulator with GAF, ATPase, and Fis domain